MNLPELGRALGFAERACALTEESVSDRFWAHLDTMALAQRVTGGSAEALETQKCTIALMPEGADPTVAQRLAKYEAAVSNR